MSDMKKEFRGEECEHEWEVDSGSGDNTVDMYLGNGVRLDCNHMKTGNTNLRMQCELCDTAIWVVQYAVCSTNTGSIMICNVCEESEANCDCKYCTTCDEEEDDCECEDDE